MTLKASATNSLFNIAWQNCTAPCTVWTQLVQTVQGQHAQKLQEEPTTKMRSPREYDNCYRGEVKVMAWPV